jgi:hypothetical protein
MGRTSSTHGREMHSMFLHANVKEADHQEGSDIAVRIILKWI